MKTTIKSWTMFAAAVALGLAAIGQTDAGRSEKHVTFLKDDAGWYADIAGTRKENAMVAGADALIEVMARGSRRVDVTFSHGKTPPMSYDLHLKRVEKDRWGATYLVTAGNSGVEMPAFEGMLGKPLIWLCNQTRLVADGDLPRNIYVQAVSRGSGDAPSLVQAARNQIGVTVRYNPAYRRLAYPNGDVPREEGVCVDVVIRALRDAHGIDLQKLVHEDMTKNFSAYPANWGLKKPDSNIDHRRVPNLQCYFKRHGWSRPMTKKAADYLPGDIVTCTVAGKLPHIMVVSDRKNAAGTHLVIHNIGAGAREEDSLFAYPLTGHYRVPEKATP